MLRLLATAGSRVVVIEDLHWADADTLAVVEYLLDHAADAASVVVTTVRPEPDTAATVLVEAAAGVRPGQGASRRLVTCQVPAVVVALA
jgi:hypothetical protein